MLSQIKLLIKKVIPRSLLRWRSAKLRRREEEVNARLSASEVFSRIYEQKKWGKDVQGYYSGSGSVGGPARIYSSAILSFIENKGIKSVVDLGCGDFRIGKKISEKVDSYIGIDVVPSLIQNNKEKFKLRNVQFYCLDATTDVLPDGDLCLIRQVFQHLSNKQIAKILLNLTRYSFIIVSEHFPGLDSGFIPNKDKIHGGDTRVYENSAVVLNEPPFFVSPLSKILTVAVEDVLVSSGETIQSYLFQGTAIKRDLLAKEFSFLVDEI